MILKVFFFISLFCIYNVKAQSAAVEPCSAIYNNYCKNNGFCVVLFGREIQCTCPVGFTGALCEISQSLVVTTTTTTTTIAPVAVCPSNINVCQNFGSCLILNGKDFICSCAQGFTGTYCEIRITTTTTTTTQAPIQVFFCPANLNYCFNNGACFIINGNYQCSCLSGFSGLRCEISSLTTTTTTTTSTSANGLVSPCPSNVNICQNGGQCLVFSGQQLVCACPASLGFTGTLCEIPSGITTTTTTLSPGACVSSPCRNGGTCLNLLNSSFVCVCQNGFFGLNCETTSCSPNPCKNNQDCFFSSGKLNCLCVSAYTGKYCETTL